MRRRKAEPREINPDRKFGSVLVSKFINHVMLEGKKAVAEKIVYSALAEAEKKAAKPALEIFETAVKNASPLMEVKSRRIGGANYQVPREVRGERRITLAFRWILEAARNGKGSPVSKRLASELLAAAKNEGAAVKKKLDTHRMAEANRAFAHFAW